MRSSGPARAASPIKYLQAVRSAVIISLIYKIMEFVCKIMEFVCPFGLKGENTLG